METLEEFRRRRLNEADEEMTGSIEQVPQPESPALAQHVLQGAGLGLLAGLLGAAGLMKVQKMLSRRGYGQGPQALVKYAKSLAGIRGDKPYQFSPEEQKSIASKLTQVVGNDRAAFGSGGVDLIGERIKEFVPKVLDVSKASRRAVSALERATVMFSKNQAPDQQDVSTVLAALSGGGASPEFKVWFEENATKAVDVDKSQGRGKNRVSMQYTRYDLGKLPMKQVDFNLVVKYYRSIYGYAHPMKKPEMAPATAPAVNPNISDAERQAHQAQLTRTYDALRNNRGV